MLFRHVQTDIWVNYVQFVKWLSKGGNFMGIYKWTSLPFCYYFAFVIILFCIISLLFYTITYKLKSSSHFFCLEAEETYLDA